MTDSQATTLEEAAEREANAAGLTDSEKALAKVFAAIDEWRASGGHDGSRSADLLCMVCAPLVSEGMLFPGTGQPLASALALLDRARKAGVL